MTTRRASVPTVRIILALIRNQPLRYSWSLLLWITIWTMPVVIGLIVARFIDDLTADPPGGSLTVIAAALVAYGLARVTVVFLALRNHGGLLFRAGAQMAQNMIRWIYSLPGAHPVDEAPGEVVSRFRDDVDHTVEAFDFTVDLVGALVAALVAVMILVTIDPLITLVVFAPLVIVIFVASKAGTRIRRYRAAARNSTEAITGFLGETLGSVQSVKVAGAEQHMIEHFADLNEHRRRMMVRDRTLTAGLESVFRNTVNIGTGLILILAAGSISTTGEAGLTVGEFSLFVFLLAMVTESAFFLGLFLARVKQAGVSAERIIDLMKGARWTDLVARRDLGLDDRHPRTSPTVPVGAGAAGEGLRHLEVRGLTYSYNGSGAGIADVDLELAGGEFVVVTGRIGSGKTTLLRAILGLVPTQSGSIRWNDTPVDDPAAFMVPPRSAYTPQVPGLFSMSLRDNLLLGLETPHAVLDGAIHTATMEHDVAAMPEGLETLVGPRGMRLSGGQVQRSASARMLVRQPDLLVFDDLSSALDVETEGTLWERLFADHSNATALVVSHRRPAFHRADRIVVMRAGRIESVGTIEELLAASPEFRRLWSSDFSEE